MKNINSELYVEHRNDLRRGTRVVYARGDEHTTLAIDQDCTLIVSHIDRLPYTRSCRKRCYAQ